jgi:hypothetical protein
VGATPTTNSHVVPYPRRHCAGADEEEQRRMEPVVEIPQEQAEVLADIAGDPE